MALAVATVAFCAVLDQQRQNRRMTKAMLRKQQCVAAAQAQLDCIQQTGRSLGRQELAKLWPGVELKTTRTRGKGDWQGLDRVQVRAEGSAGELTVRVNLCRYMLPDRKEDRP